jgi:hypothetical protein
VLQDWSLFGILCIFIYETAFYKFKTFDEISWSVQIYFNDAKSTKIWKLVLFFGRRDPWLLSWEILTFLVDDYLNVSYTSTAHYGDKQQSNWGWVRLLITWHQRWWVRLLILWIKSISCWWWVKGRTQVKYSKTCPICSCRKYAYCVHKLLCMAFIFLQFVLSNYLSFCNLF